MSGKGRFAAMGRLCLAALAISGLIALEPIDAAASTTGDRLLIGRACDAPDLRPWLAESDGSDQLELVDLPDPRSARVSPKGSGGQPGQYIVFTAFRGLMLYDLVVGDLPRVLVSAEFGRWFTHLAWSPDGKHIAYVAQDDLKKAIWIHELGGGMPDEMLLEVAQGALVTGIDWSPDGSTLVWSELSGDQAQIFAVDVDSAITKSLGAGDTPRYSPDGLELAFVLNNRIGTMSADGTAVFLSNSIGWSPTWSPTGNEIAFVERIGGSTHVTIFEPDSGQLTRIISSTVECDDNFVTWDWAQTQVPTFDDVPFDHLFYSDVEWLADEGITKGCGSSEFCPDDSVTRGQMAAFLVRAMGYTDAGAGDLFMDDDQSIFEADIDKLGTAGVTRGCNPPVNDRFCPEGLVTRGQMAAFLVRALGLTDNGGGDLFVDDDNSIFEADIDKLRTAGITKGCNPPANDHFCPNDVVTRGQIAAFLRRALG